MEDIAIRVRADHTGKYAAERATVHCSLALQGPVAAVVLDHVTAAHRALLGTITALHDPEAGPITWFAVDQLHTSVHTPRDRDGNPLAVEHSASFDVRVKFRDFAALSGWVLAAGVIDGFTVQHVDWTLTEPMSKAAQDECRKQAVLAARDKAQSYADALELGPVRVVSIADEGLSLTPEPGSARLMMIGSSAETGRDGDGDDDFGSGDLFVPRHVAITSGLTASFTVTA